MENILGLAVLSVNFSDVRVCLLEIRNWPTWLSRAQLSNTFSTDWKKHDKHYVTQPLFLCQRFFTILGFRIFTGAMELLVRDYYELPNFTITDRGLNAMALALSFSLSLSLFLRRWLKQQAFKPCKRLTWVGWVLQYQLSNLRKSTINCLFNFKLLDKVRQHLLVL